MEQFNQENNEKEQNRIPSPDVDTGTLNEHQNEDKKDDFNYDDLTDEEIKSLPYKYRWEYEAYILLDNDAMADLLLQLMDMEEDNTSIPQDILNSFTALVRPIPVERFFRKFRG